MEETKNFLLSKGIWSSIATMLVGVLIATGVFTPDQGAVVQDAFPDLAVGLVTVVSGALSAYGRYAATKQVTIT